MLVRTWARRALAIAAIVGVEGCTSVLGVDKDYHPIGEGGGGSGGASATSTTGTPPAGGNAGSPSGGGDHATGGDGGASTLTPSCGDGTLSEPEECDDGNPSDDDACSNTCEDQLVLAVAAGHEHTCALLSGGHVKCWGSNKHGELGLGLAPGDTKGGLNDMGGDLAFVSLGQAALAITTRFLHTCALLSDGTVKCWGYNGRGQLGLGDSVERADAGEVTALDFGQQKAIAVAAGEAHTCVLLDNGRIRCWGDGSSGQLGFAPGATGAIGDAAEEMSKLIDVDLGTDPDGDPRTATAIAAGANHTCALLSDGAVKCWGRNDDGQLGVGSTTDHGLDDTGMGEGLEAMPLGEAATAVTAGAGFSCALLTSGAVKCCGGDHGVHGLGDTKLRCHTAGSVPAAAEIDRDLSVRALAIAGGDHHVCAILSGPGGEMKCWGRGAEGELGTDSIASVGDGYYYPQPGTAPRVIALTDATAMSGGWQHTCAVTGGRLKCWGVSYSGRLGAAEPGYPPNGSPYYGDHPGEMAALPFVRLFGESW